ncbi:glycine--tRNA ligase subunit beta, partial [bacterium]|nr:glycine--tRNA ligase subunit beta [bacterium]
VGNTTDYGLMVDEERLLADSLEVAELQISTLMRVDHDYEAALAALAELRAPVDAFFEKVLVMDPDPDVRRNRLALLNRLGGLFADFADFGKLAG